MYHGSGARRRESVAAFDRLVQLLGVVIVSVLIVSACGRAVVGGGAASTVRTTPTPPASPLSTPSTQPSGSWKTYSDQHGYTITYPSTWVDKGPDDNQGSHDFVSVKADGIYGMSENGVWLAIRLSPDGDCQSVNVGGTIRNQFPITVDGSNGIETYVDYDFAYIVVNVAHDRVCFTFEFIWKSSNARAGGASLAEQIVRGVHFTSA